MRTVIRIASVFAVSLCLLSGCHKSIIKYGEDVVFRASTNTSNYPTRADYSGEIVSSVERIDWEEGDKLRIASAEVSEPASKHSDYLIEEVSTSGRYSNAKITVSLDDNPAGLRWGSGEHHFYAVYPSPVMGGVTKSQNGNIASGEIAASQAVESFSGTVAAKVAKPSFDASMMMVAKTTVSEDSNPRDVSLEFVPMTTAIQFTITNKTGEPMTTCKVELESENHPLSGPFNCDIATGSSTFTGNPASCSKVCIDFGEPIVTPVDGTLTFTLFLNPADNPDDLTLSIYEESNKCRFTSLKTADGSAVEFKSGVKAVVTGIFVPAGAVWKVAQKNNLYSWTDGTVKDVDIE